MKTKYIVSKVYKVPIEGVSFSNKQVGLSIEYEPVGNEKFNIVEANDEVNQMLTVLKESDPAWVSQLTLKNEKGKEVKK